MLVPRVRVAGNGGGSDRPRGQRRVVGRPLPALLFEGQGLLMRDVLCGRRWRRGFGVRDGGSSNIFFVIGVAISGVVVAIGGAGVAGVTSHGEHHGGICSPRIATLPPSQPQTSFTWGYRSGFLIVLPRPHIVSRSSAGPKQERFEAANASSQRGNRTRVVTLAHACVGLNPTLLLFLELLSSTVARYPSVSGTAVQPRAREGYGEIWEN